MRRLAQAILRSLARHALLRYRPHIVGITGSYGKTSAKEAIAEVLAQAYVIRASRKSFNTEFGLPFTVLAAAGATPIRQLFSAVGNGMKLLFGRQPYPTILVLEMGADRPGDISQLLDLAPLTVGVVTSVGPTHLQRFGSVEAVFAEKSLIAQRLDEHGWAVLNADDPRVRSLVETAPSRVVTYGFQSGVAVRCLDAAPGKNERGEWGMVLNVEFGREQFPAFLPGVVGRHSAYAALAAAAVGVAFHMDLVEISEGLKRYTPPPGRMRVLPGVKHTIIIDDSYNSSPDVCVAALEALREFPVQGRRYALLGEMADLGSATEPAHKAIGKTIVDEQIDFLVAVGEKMKDAVREAKRLGMSEDRVFAFADPVSAARFVQDRLHPGDVVLIKGSQVARMEKATKELMAEPQRAHELLVRQEGKWLRT